MKFFILNIHFLLFLHSLFLTIFASGQQRCRFPADWKGRYFQSGLGEISIRDNQMTTKGFCVEQNRDYYLVENRDSNCFHCLLILRQHYNVIQYKESHCAIQSDMKTICAQIEVETQLYTLVREPSKSIDCPFEGRFKFDYDDLTSGFCSRKLSSLSTCSSSHKYKINFKHCKPAATYHNKEMEMDCLATWRDGSETYLYVRISSSDSAASKDEKYRCLKLQNFGGDIVLSMSVDATCRGIRSASDGPFLMQLTKEGPPSQPLPCLFPDWLGGQKWRDTTGLTSFSLSHEGSVISAEARRPPEGSGSAAESVFVCRKLVAKEMAGTREEAVYLAASMHKCEYKLQCLKFQRLDKTAILLSYGTTFDENTQKNCMSEVYSRRDLLLPLLLTVTPCPRQGVHHTVPEEGCIHRINVGCHNTSTIEIDHSCSAGSNGISLQCMAHWNENSKTYLLIKPRLDDVISCYSFRQENDALIFGKDVCFANQPQKIKEGHIYHIQRQDICRTRLHISTRAPPSPPLPSASSPRYRHVQEAHPRDKAQPPASKNRPTTTTNRAKAITPRPPSPFNGEYNYDDDDEDDDIFRAGSGGDRSPDRTWKDSETIWSYPKAPPERPIVRPVPPSHSTQLRHGKSSTWTPPSSKDVLRKGFGAADGPARPAKHSINFSGAATALLSVRTSLASFCVLAATVFVVR